MKSPPQSHDAAPSTFHLFPLLAAELRLKIWFFTITPRTLSICYLPVPDICSSNNGVPPILHANRESRHEALRTYHLSFETHKSPAQIYFAPWYDTIYLPRYRAMGYDETLRDFRKFLKRPEELDAVRWLGLDYVEGDMKRPWESYDKAVLIKSFPMLEKIYLVLGLRRRLRERERYGERRENKKETVFVAPREGANEMVRVWTEFRKAFAREEEVMRKMALVDGRDDKAYVLPPVEVVSRRLEGGTRYDEM